MAKKGQHTARQKKTLAKTSLQMPPADIPRPVTHWRPCGGCGGSGRRKGKVCSFCGGMRGSWETRWGYGIKGRSAGTFAIGKPRSIFEDCSECCWGIRKNGVCNNPDCPSNK